MPAKKTAHMTAKHAYRTLPAAWEYERNRANTLLAALEKLDGALTPHLEALRTSRTSMNHVENAIYSAAIDARSAIKVAQS